MLRRRGRLPIESRRHEAVQVTFACANTGHAARLGSLIVFKDETVVKSGCFDPSEAAIGREKGVIASALREKKKSACRTLEKFEQSRFCQVLCLCMKAMHRAGQSHGLPSGRFQPKPWPPASWTWSSAGTRALRKAAK